MKWFKGVSRTSIFIGIVVLIAGGALFVGYTLSDSREVPSPVEAFRVRPVKVLQLQDPSESETRTLPGITQPATETDLAFRVGGPLIGLDVGIGQKVLKGQVMARIDPRDFEIQVKRLQARISEAKANLKAMVAGARTEDIAALEAELAAAVSRLKEARTNFNRHRRLYEEKAIPRARFDSARTAFETSQARVKQAKNALAKARRGARQEEIMAMQARIQGLEADLTAARNALADTRLLAPFDGYVHEKHVENFETVAPGQPILSLIDTRQVEVRTRVPDGLMTRQSDWAGISVMFEHGAGAGYPAQIKELSQKTLGPGQSFAMILSVSLPDGVRVYPGTAADVTIEMKAPEAQFHGWQLPATAIFADDQGNPAVWKVLPDTLTLKKVPVTAVTILQKTVQVTGQLNKGDLVVCAGARFLRENQKIQLLDDRQGGLM